MCVFLSAIGLKDGSILTSPEYTDSHRDLIVAHGLERYDTSPPELVPYVSLEYKSPSGSLYDPNSYTLTLDQQSAPCWWTEERHAQAASELDTRIRRMIINDKRTLLLGGCWILGPEANVGMMYSARIIAMYGKARILSLRGRSHVLFMRDTSTIHCAVDFAVVSALLHEAGIYVLRGCAAVGNAQHSSHIGTMYGNTHVDGLWDNAVVEGMFDRATIGKMSGESRVDHISNDALIYYKGRRAKVGSIHDRAQILASEENQ